MAASHHPLSATRPCSRPPRAFQHNTHSHQFTSEGAVGGTVERMAEKEEAVGERIEREARQNAAPQPGKAAEGREGHTEGGGYDK